MSSINSILRAAQVLKALSSGPTTITALCGKLGLSGSTLHRQLKTLEDTGFVVQDPLTKQYALGPLIPALTLNPTVSHHFLITSAQEEMEQLRAMSGESVALVIRMGLQRVQLEELPSLNTLKYSAGRGFTAPLHCGATGKVILSEMVDEEIEKLLTQMSFEKIGPSTITNRHHLMDEVLSVRKQGYAISTGEIVEGAASLAVPIRGYFCPVAMCILAPENRFSPKIPEYIKVCQEKSGAISEKLKKLIHL